MERRDRGRLVGEKRGQLTNALGNTQRRLGVLGLVEELTPVQAHHARARARRNEDRVVGTVVERAQRGTSHSASRAVVPAVERRLPAAGGSAGLALIEAKAREHVLGVCHRLPGDDISEAGREQDDSRHPDMIGDRLPGVHDGDPSYNTNR